MKIDGCLAWFDECCAFFTSSLIVFLPFFSHLGLLPFRVLSSFLFSFFLGSWVPFLDAHFFDHYFTNIRQRDLVVAIISPFRDETIRGRRDIQSATVIARQHWTTLSPYRTLRSHHRTPGRKVR